MNRDGWMRMNGLHDAQESNYRLNLDVMLFTLTNLANK